MSVCPIIPSYFGYNNTCVASCPNNTYADNFTRLCLLSTQCNNVTYGDPTSQTCVSVCPFNYYADVRNTSLLCVQVCPTGWYADDATKHCSQVPKYNLWFKYYFEMCGCLTVWII